jgi:hypothetical protein
MSARDHLWGPDTAADRLRALVHAGHDRLPLPAAGRTVERWRQLAAVAREDLSLAKLYEGHTDALAILAELGGGCLPQAGSTWGVWAAEAPQCRTHIADRDAIAASHAAAGAAAVAGTGEAAAPREGADDREGADHREGSDCSEATGTGQMAGLHGQRVRLNGRKAWCSGAGTVSHALVTAWDPGATQPQLVAVDMGQRGITVHLGPWQAIGMAGSPALEVHFDNAEGLCIGAPGDYLTRPGFWHGGAGVAACWYGGAEAIAAHAWATWASAGRPCSPLQHAAAGHVDVLLAGMRAVLEQAARWIDAHPGADARAVALRTRLAVETGATQVLDAVGRALGAGPFCQDPAFARAAADLPVFLRQSHAERDFAALGELALQAQGAELQPWAC